MVKPTLDYASPSWDPYTKDDINEKVQRRGARFVCNIYTDRNLDVFLRCLDSHNWTPLITRRYNQRIIMLLKLQHGMVGIDECTILRPGDQRTRGAYGLSQPPATLSMYKFSFFLRTIRYWNRLPTTDCHTLVQKSSRLH